MGKKFKDHRFGLPIRFVWGSDRFGFLVVWVHFARFGFLEQIGGLEGSRFSIFRFDPTLVLNICTLVYKNDFFSDENFYHTHTMAWVLVVVHLMLWSKSCCQDRFCAHSNFHTELRTQIWLAHFTLSVLLGARRCAIM